MIFRVTFKTPGVTEDAIKDAVFAESECDCGLCPECRQTYKDMGHDAMTELAEKFVQYGEYVTIEFCTDSQTATVVPL